MPRVTKILPLAWWGCCLFRSRFDHSRSFSQSPDIYWLTTRLRGGRLTVSGCSPFSLQRCDCRKQLSSGPCGCLPTQPQPWSQRQVASSAHLALSFPPFYFVYSQPMCGAPHIHPLRESPQRQSLSLTTAAWRTPCCNHIDIQNNHQTCPVHCC